MSIPVVSVSPAVPVVPVLPAFFSALDSASTGFKLGNSMLHFLDAFRIINGIPFPTGVTRKFMLNGVDIIPCYQNIVNDTTFKTTGTTSVSISCAAELKIPDMTMLNFVDSNPYVIDVVSKFNTKNSDGTYLYNITKASRNLVYDVMIRSTSQITFDTYVENVRQKLKNILDAKVFELYTTKLSNFKGVSMPNKAQKIHDMSLFDTLMVFVDSNSSMTLGSTVTGRQLAVFNHLNNINTFFNTMKDDGDDLNQMIININNKQLDIQSQKESIKQVKEKLYTLMSRDKNYTTVLSYRRRKLYIYIVLLVIVCIIFGSALFSQNIDLTIKNFVVISVAVVILVIQILSQVLGLIRQSRVKETFIETRVVAFTDPLQTPMFVSQSTSTTIDIPYVLVNFVDKYDKTMTNEVKSEYYESITDKQEKDASILAQLHKENETQKHLHQLKNSLTYFKINETREYTSYVTYALILVSLLAILYLAVLNSAVNFSIFVIAGILSVVAYLTYVLLSVKSIMLRDKYDWDRFNWTMKNVNSNSNQERCALPGR